MLVLSTKTVGIPDMFDDGVEGLLFEPIDEASALKCTRQSAVITWAKLA